MDNVRDQRLQGSERTSEAFPRFSARREVGPEELTGEHTPATTRLLPPIPVSSVEPPSVWRRHAGLASDGQAKQLSDFMDAISFRPGATATAQVGLVRALSAFGGDAGAIVAQDRVISSVGIPTDETSRRAILAVSSGSSELLELPHLGTCAATAEPRGVASGTSIVIARSWSSQFTPAEHMLLRSMAAAMGLALAAERPNAVPPERSPLEFLDRISQIQRKVLAAEPIETIMKAIADAAVAQIGCDFCSLRIIDTSGDRMRLLASVGGDPALQRLHERIDVRDGLGGDDMIKGQTPERREIELAAHGAGAVYMAPVPGDAPGRLTVGTRAEGRICDPGQRRFLSSLADLAAICLSHGRAVERIERETTRDPITGLPNRASLLSKTEAAIRAVAAGPGSSASPPALLVLKIHGIRTITESVGHVAADTLIRNVAARFAPITAGIGTLARPDETHIAVLTTQPFSSAELQTLAESLVEAAAQPFEIDGRTIALGACVGIARTGSDAANLMRNAEQALTRTEVGSKRKVVSFDPSMQSIAFDRLALRAELEQAIETDQLVLHYQPLFDLIQGHITGFEALVRWQSPTRGLVLPDDFIGLAEESGLILPLGRWVLGQAAQDAARLAGLSSRPIRVGVNISGVQLREDSLVEDVEWAIAEAGIDPSLLYLEITESVLVDDSEASIERIHRLRDIGTALAIDDFGMGHSALKYLPGFPLDMLKLDRFFVSRIGNGESEALITAIVSLANSLGLEIIAEGIERSDQPQPLVALGCRIGQGHSLCPPIPIEEAASFLAEWESEADSND